MKKFFLHLILSLSVITVSYSQNLIQNGDFQNCSSFSPGCTPWEVSHGGPGIDSESNGNHYVYLISGSSAYGQALTNGLYYPGISFSTYYEYQLTFKIRSDGGASNLLTVKLANGLTPRNIGGTVPLPTVTNQLINTSYAESDNWETVSLTFRPTAEYNQLWLYCYDGVGTTLLDDVTLTKTLIGDNGCCSPNITYSNNTGTNPLPGFTKRSDYIKANTNVKVMSGNTVAFQAGNYILLEPSFETQANATFSAYIGQCPSSAPVADAGPDIYECYTEQQQSVEHVDSILCVCGGGTRCRQVGSLSVSGVTYNWTASPSTYIDKLAPVSSSDPLLCGVMPPGNTTYTVTASNACGVSTDQMIFYNPSCNGRQQAYDELGNALESAISYYPNPTHDNFYVALPPGSQNARLSLKDVTGKEVLYQSLTTTETKISTTNIFPGVYILVVETENESINEKMIIQ